MVSVYYIYDISDCLIKNDAMEFIMVHCNVLKYGLICLLSVLHWYCRYNWAIVFCSHLLYTNIIGANVYVSNFVVFVSVCANLFSDLQFSYLAISSRTVFLFSYILLSCVTVMLFTHYIVYLLTCLLIVLFPY